ncbi:MAG: tetratricopeptide repeat protein [Candidatus Obscuribacterales bacterium]|nr:tetratricopeptide repeat protein [Candidatus Obscuribacterales bacterium]
MVRSRERRHPAGFERHSYDVISVSVTLSIVFSLCTMPVALADPQERKEQLTIPAISVNKSLPLKDSSAGKQNMSVAATTANPAAPATQPSSTAAGPASSSESMDYTIHGKPATKEQYQAAMLVDEGIMLLRSNSNEQALQKLKQAMALYDGLPEGHHALGVVYTKQGKFEEAQKSLKRSLELNPDSENTWLMLAGSYQAANDLPHTIRTYNDFLTKFPKSANAPKINQNLAILYAQLGFLYAKQGKSEEAISELKGAIKLNPTLDSPWLTLASVYQASGRIEDAMAVYEEFSVKFKNHSMSAQVKGLLDALKKEKDRLRRNAQNELAVSGPKTPIDTTGSGAVGGGKEPPAGDGTGSASGEQGADSAKDSTADPQANAAKKPEGRDDYLSFMVQNEYGFKRWPKTRIPITVYIHDGIKVPGFRDSFKTILKQSFEDWAKASNGGVTFQYVDSPRSALLQVFWTDKVSDLKNPAEAGDARLFMDQNYISRAEVWLLTKPVAMPLTDNYFRLISLHEIGHSLGLSGHTTNPDDIMFYSATFKDAWRELSGRDSRSITRLYQNDI